MRNSLYSRAYGQTEDELSAWQPPEDSSWIMSLSDLMSLLLIFFLVWTTVKVHRFHEDAQASSVAKRPAGVADLSRLKGMLFGFDPVETPDGSVLVVLDGEVTFPSGSDTLSKDGQRMLHTIANVLKKSTHYRLKVLGHTDKVPVLQGSRFRSNLDLSYHRAVAVANELVEQGVSPERIWVQGLGDRYPRKAGGPMADDGLNRRVELLIEPAV